MTVVIEIYKTVLLKIVQIFVPTIEFQFFFVFLAKSGGHK